MTRYATVDYTPTHAVVKCPNGHLVTAIKLGRDFAGSMEQANLSAHAAGLPNPYDRLAEKCAHHDRTNA